jgi:hypothetical protein
MGWSIQICGSSCFSTFHLDANGLYVKVPKFHFTLPSAIADLNEFNDVLSKLLTFRKSLYNIADTIEESLLMKHSVESALGRADSSNNSVDPRIY